MGLGDRNAVRCDEALLVGTDVELGDRAGPVSFVISRKLVSAAMPSTLRLAAMPLQNRVTPLGELIADPARGLVYGNRGCLHDDDGSGFAARSP